MAREKKLTSPVTLFCAVEAEQHATLRGIAYDEHRSLADVVRQALDEFVERRAAAPPARKTASSRSARTTV